ncbi:TetR/AcrR family transcriptional regulator [Leucobacter sp. wl10]|uniref:TetR/AcrR family transcriptional regulator n=1 Tax=Leucobacter sp. wl10 TaxID=2304677 RepID=UPI000E5BBAD1|nr:TetR/AcrR family transcriptional regulator [Leucobacter sp. wl10]RGE21419.1 TetR/AcrR family transcriptional regulator [Leucobacter sp. wl10]
MTSSRPYHHGNLRQAVLDEAATVVRDRGAAELSLREVAATIGVTHAAPRRYFPGRQELLDALAAEGFARLGNRLRDAVDVSPDYPTQVQAVATAYLDFATSEANLVELMFANKHGAYGEAVSRSAEVAFAPMLDMFQRARFEGLLADRSPERLSLIFLATLQGLAGLINCGVIPPSQLGELIDEAVQQFPHRV